MVYQSPGPCEITNLEAVSNYGQLLMNSEQVNYLLLCYSQQRVGVEHSNTRSACVSFGKLKFTSVL